MVADVGVSDEVVITGGKAPAMHYSAYCPGLNATTH